MEQIYGANLYLNSTDVINGTINEKTLENIKEMGMKYLLICPVITSQLTSDSIKLMNYTLNDIEKSTNLIKEKGFKYGVKFHINNPDYSNTFVTYHPKDPDQWFEKYFDLVKKILEKMSPEFIDMICIVNEAPKLTRTKIYRNKFEYMKKELKELYPWIKYSQSGIGGEYSDFQCPIWDVFDILCENNYPGSKTYFTDKKCPTIYEMEKVIYENGLGFEKAYQYYRKPFMLTEFGCLPYDGWFKYPASWGENTKNATYNPDVQYNYYSAYLNCRIGHPYITGLFVWSLTDLFGPQGRKAENVFKDKWGQYTGDNEQQSINNHVILHTGNHCELFNPHPQYVLKKDYQLLQKEVKGNEYNLLMELNKDYYDKYIELVSITSKYLNTDSNNVLVYDFKMVMDGNLSEYPNLGEIYIKINNTKNNYFAKTIFMNGNFNINRFNYILFEEDGNLVYKLYYKIDRNWSSIQCKKEYVFNANDIYNINCTGKLLDDLPIIDNYNYDLVEENKYGNN